MKKQFLFLSMLLTGLFAVSTTARAAMTPEQAETKAYWARLTAQPASTTAGTGTVSVNVAEVAEEDAVFESVSSKDSYTETFAMIDGAGSVGVEFKSVYAKAADGSYLAGWSYTDGGTDMTIDSETSIFLTPSMEKGHSNIRAYNLYAAFQPIRWTSYSIAETQKVVSRVSTHTVTIFAEADVDKGAGLGAATDTRHFKLPVVTKKDGTLGTWTVDVTEWNTENIKLQGGTAKITVVVTLTAPDDDPREYAATLTMETKAGVKLNIPLYTRYVNTSLSGRANLYDEDKELKSSNVIFAEALNNAAAGDIIQLLGDFDDANTTIDKDITLDLNGFDFKKWLIISGDVTIAYNPFGGKVSELVIVSNGGKLTANGGTLTGSMAIDQGAAVVINGATVGDKVTNHGTLTLTDGELSRGVLSYGTLTVNGGTIKNESGTAVSVMSGGTAVINRGSVWGFYYGLDVSGGTVTIEKLAAVSGGTNDINRVGGVVTVNNGKFSDPNKFVDGDITFNAGYFKTNENNVTSVLGKPIWKNTVGTEYREGYTLFAGTQEAAQTSGVSACRINNVSYSSLEDALAYANNNPSKPVVIFMVNDYTLPAGYYTIPENATLVVPMSDEQDAPNLTVEHKSVGKTESYVTPYEFRRLTLANGVQLNVLGALEVTCVEACKSGAAMQSIPYGPYGHLVLQEGSHITLSAGSELRAWGYVTGTGEIDARRGSVVREQFQIGDWKGGDISYTMIMDSDPQRRTYLFPLYEYFIQNVEAPVKYHPGSALLCATAVEVSSSPAIRAYANDIKLVGVQNQDAAMFLMDQKADAENTWVRKWYDHTKDQQVYEVNSGAQLGNMVINLGEIPYSRIKPGMPGTMDILMDSRKFVLPLTSNFKIHLLSGQMEFTQSTACLPGMEVEIDKESTISIVNENPEAVAGALYLYDADQWGAYVRGNTPYGTIVNYSATVGHKPNVRKIDEISDLGDAKLIVHGTFQMNPGCAVYTTAGKKLKEGTSDVYVADLTSGGACITSTNEDAGTFIFWDDAMPSNELTVTEDGGELADIGGIVEGEELNQDVLINYDSNEGLVIKTALKKYEHIYNFQLCTSARLKNTDGSFINTYTDNTHYALEGDAYCFIQDQWRILRVDEDNECFLKDVADHYNPVYYIKPQEYVAINATKDGSGIFHGNADHTFSDAAGAGRLFILLNDGSCQWWEVENKDNLYHCIHPQNDTYYYWVDDNTYPEGGYWAEKRFIITWQNWDGTVIPTADEHGNPTPNYSVTYGTMAEFLGSNPTREPSIDYTYDFIGWSPALAPVTQDVVYTAVYTPKERKYTIIFLNEGGTEIERQFLGHNDVPVCENVPVRTGFTLQWTPAIAAVTGDATYTATWLEVPPTAYEITFVDYDGDVENHTILNGPVAVGCMPEPPAIVDGKPDGAEGKPATPEFTYVFDHWSPNVVEVTQAMTYVAVYREEPIKYTVTFLNEDNSFIESGEYEYGETPACTNTPTKPNTPEYSYTLTWTPKIQTVMGNATYKADFETLKTKNQYTVAIKCSPANAAVVTGGGLYEYNPANNAVTINIVSIASGYTFLGWTDSGTEYTRQMPVTGDIDLTAVFVTNDPDWTITWMNESGSEILQKVEQMDNTPTTYTGTTPTKPSSGSTAYVFDGWTDNPNGAGNYYKNGLTPKATADATYYAHFKEEEVANDLILGVNDTHSMSSDETFDNLYISSNGVDASSQIAFNGHQLSATNAYFDLTLNARARQWYQFAVPWEVDAATGISVNGVTLSLGSNFDVIYHNSYDRAAAGPNRYTNWTYVADGETLKPGTLYMIVLMSNTSTVRFTKKDGAPISTTETAVSLYPSTLSDEDANWNGVSNPALFHAFVNPGVQYGQIYVARTEGDGDGHYDIIDFSERKFVVGRGAFVQVELPKTIEVSYGGSYAAARRRMKASDTDINAKYEVRLAPINKAYTDRIFIRMNNEKEQDVYTIGKDLAKMGVSAKIPQMWVNRYDTKLCLNTMTPVEGSVDYPLSIFAPKDGEYTIGMKFGATTDTQSDLYLTLDGQAIWNLSRNAYVINLEQGTTNRYGLRVSAKAPQSTQAIDEILVDSKDETAVKVLINGQVFIIRGGEIYTITGNKVK